MKNKSEKYLKQICKSSRQTAIYTKWSLINKAIPFGRPPMKKIAIILAAILLASLAIIVLSWLVLTIYFYTGIGI